MIPDRLACESRGDCHGSSLTLLGETIGFAAGVHRREGERKGRNIVAFDGKGQSTGRKDSSVSNGNEKRD